MNDITKSSKINAKKPTTPTVKQGSYRQLMSPVHTWFGLLMGWLLYLVFFMGTLSYFKDEITLWSTPAIVSSTAPTTDDVLIWAVKQAQQDYPNAQSITAKAADGRTPLTVTIRGEKRSDRETLILANDGTLTKVSTWSLGGDFFYRLHYNLHYMDAITARWIIGFASVMMFVAIITGVIVHKKFLLIFLHLDKKKDNALGLMLITACLFCLCLIIS